MLLLVATALACDDAVFSALPLPAPAVGGRGIVSGTLNVEGRDLFGARLSRVSTHSLDAWREELLRPEHHDEWQPARFGNERAERVDADHVYLRADVGFLFDAVHIRRQVIAKIVTIERRHSFRACWKAVDPTPFFADVARWATDAPWETALAGGWDVREKDGGGTIVSYQWWTSASGVPDAVLGWAAADTLPAMLDSFDEHVGIEEARVKAPGIGK